MQQNQNTVLLNGIGGMGKSELLHYWVHQVAKGEIKLGYDNIMYISCTNGIANVFENNSIEAQALGIQPDNPNKLETAKFKLSQLDNLLLVLDDLPWEEQPYIDNINNVNQLCSLTPHVIATSRREYNNFEKVSVPALDVEDAVKLFNNHFEPALTATCENAIKQIVQRAGRHTLTIEILAKTASENEWSATRLLETLEANHFDYETLDTDVEYTKAGKHAEETLHNALEKLFDLSNLTDAQKQILYHLSCMDSQPFTLEVLTKWLLIKKPQSNLPILKNICNMYHKIFNKREEVSIPYIKKLIKLGWIQPSQQTNNTQFYQLHQTITHTVKTVFTKTIPANKRVALMMPVADAMQADYQGHNHETLDTACLSSISAYLTGLLAYTTDEALEVKEQIVVNILTLSKFLVDKAVFSLGINLLEATKKQIQVQLGENHPDYATSLNNLALLYEKMGEYEESLPLYEEALAIKKTQLGKKHPDYAISLNGLAMLYQSMAEYEKALPLFRQVLFINKTHLGENHPHYASSLNNLAILYESLCEYDTALLLYEKSLAINKTQLGGNHPHYASSLNNLAVLYVNLDEYAKALPLYKKALAIRKIQLGENHPDYAASLSDLACLYTKMNEYDKALTLCNHALDIRKTQLGENHSDYARSLNELANLYVSMGKYEKALPLYEKSLAIRKTQLGENHPDYANGLNNLAGLYYSMGWYEQALPLYEQAINIAKQVLGKAHPHTQTVIHNYLTCQHQAQNKQ